MYLTELCLVFVHSFAETFPIHTAEKNTFLYRRLNDSIEKKRQFSLVIKTIWNFAVHFMM